MSFDPFNSVKKTLSILPKSITGTETGAAIDTAGYDGCLAWVALGAGDAAADGSNYLTAKVTECATSGGSYTDVAASNIISDDASPTNAFAVYNATTDDEVIKCIGIKKGHLRYLKIVITETGNLNTGTLVAGGFDLTAAHQAVDNAAQSS